MQLPKRFVDGIQLHGLGQIAERAKPQRLLHKVEFGVSADHTKHRMQAACLHRAQQIDAAHFRHADVGEDHVRRMGDDRLIGGQRIRIRLVYGQPIVRPRKQHAHAFKDPWFIVHQDD